jgi:hypothetical protein
MQRITALLLVVTLALPAGALAQQPQGVDATKMGVDLSRIKRELAQAQAQAQAAEETTEGDPLRLRFTVEVVGTAPKIDLLEGFNVRGPLPYGPPTHQEFLDVVTPREFRSPTVDFLGLAVAAAQGLWKYNRKRQCEAELAEYRRLVMQGVAMAAPRCNQ